MKRILLFILLLVSINSFGQILQKNNTYGMSFNRTGGDTLFYLPSDTFNVPVSLRPYKWMARKASTIYLWNTSTFIWEALAAGGGGSGTVTSVAAGFGTNFTTITASGSVVVDSLVMSTKAWRQKGIDSVVSLIPVYTAALPLRKTGFQFSADTSVAFSPSLATNARLQKIIDSLNAIGGFAIPTLQQVFDKETGGALLNKSDTINNSIYNFWVRGTDGAFRVYQSGGSTGDYSFSKTNFLSQITSTTSYVAAINQQAASITTSITQHGMNSSVIVYKDSVTIAPGLGNFRIDSLNYNSDANLVSVVQDTTNGKIYRKTITGGITSSDTSAMLSPYLRGATEGFGIDISGSQHKTWSADTTSGGVTSWVRTKKVIDSIAGLLPPGSTSLQYDVIDDNKTGAAAFYGFNRSSNGTGSAAAAMTSANIKNGWMYGYVHSTGTQTTGYSYWANVVSSVTGNPMAVSSGVRFNCGTKIQINDLSDGTDTYNFWFGFGKITTDYTAVDNGVFVRYIHSDSSGAFIFRCVAASTATEDAVDVTVAADTDYQIEISVFGGSAYLYINNVLRSTISTNVPSGTSQWMEGPIGVIRKSAGTASRDVFVDWSATGVRLN